MAGRPGAGPGQAVGDTISRLAAARAEGRKISWPSWKETWITSLMVFIMVLITTAFFAIADLVLGWGVSKIVALGS